METLPREILNIIGYQYFSVIIDIECRNGGFRLIVKFPQVSIYFNIFFPIFDIDGKILFKYVEEDLSKLKDFIKKIQDIKGDPFNKIRYEIYNPPCQGVDFSICISDVIKITSRPSFSALSLDLSLLPQLINALNKYVTSLEKLAD